MNLFLLYLLKVNSLLLVCLAFYGLVLRKNTFFTCNRFYFITVWFTLLILPAVDFSVFFPASRVFVLPLPVYSNGAPARITLRIKGETVKN